MSTQITAENAHLYAANTAPIAHCGVLNTNTGEWQEGYTDRKGNLVYRNPLPWWKRLFGKKKIVPLWSDWEYQTPVAGKQTFWEGGMFRETKYHEWDTSIHIYRQTHRYTGARRYYAKGGLVTMRIETDAWERFGR